MAKRPLCDASYPVIPEVCRRPSDCQLKNLLHHSSCHQGALYYEIIRGAVSALRHTLYCCLYRYTKGCGGGDIPMSYMPRICGKTTDLYFMVSFPHQASILMPLNKLSQQARLHLQLLIKACQYLKLNGRAAACTSRKSWPCHC